MDHLSCGGILLGAGVRVEVAGRGRPALHRPKLSANLSPMATDRKEPEYLFTEKQIAEKSEIARRFLHTRTRHY